MHEVLIQDCSETRKDIEECASYLCHDFGQFVIPLMGGPSATVDFASRFSKSKIRLLGSSEKILKCTLLYVKKKRPLNKLEKRLLVKFASALARVMSLSLPTSSSEKTIPLNYEEIFPVTNIKKNEEMEDDEEIFEAKKTKISGLTFIEFDLDNLVQNNVGVDLMLPQITKSLSSTPPTSDKKLFGVNLSELMYDEKSGTIVRELFGYPLPVKEDMKKLKNCISHDDTQPSMNVILKPLVWRQSAKMMNLISREQDQALEEMYRGETTTIEKKADNAAVVNNCTVITYLCKAHCYSTRCKFSSVLTNMQIKQLR
uniref:Wsv137-like protein n=1 Tax=Sesarmops intermedium nimavirus TaxID=2133796 RepID=A0A401IPT6_9VIRU|nr:MAG: wsv137-like protein [Sesarmops intermedium nimavirus]GBG35622.1 wsv137-like protein [Sesarmops intermedium nimavirus]